MADYGVIGNGNILIGLDQYARIYDFYYPYIGQENHTKGSYVHKFGVSIDEKFSWIDDGTWQIDIDYAQDTMVIITRLNNFQLGLELEFIDAVYNEKNIYVRKIKVKNKNSHKAKIKIFLNQQMMISESNTGNTVLYNHDQNHILFYKGDRYFLVNGMYNDCCFDDYSVGIMGIEGREGTFRDAEDGVLSKNNVEHGSVDSVLGFSMEIESGKTEFADYWITVGKDLEEVKELDSFVLDRGIDKIIDSTGNYWFAWVNNSNKTFEKLPSDWVKLYNKSLLIIKAHSGKNGSIIASGDSHLLKQGRDAYAYVWGRDAALIAIAMIKAGYTNIAKNFLLFCTKIIKENSYLLHKYQADGFLGASWHPWVRDQKSELPIQEDETALMMICLFEYYEATHDIEFVEEVYEILIRKPAKFIISYMHAELHLPKPSYDLWEEKFGSNTFTSATVVKAMKCASIFAKILGKTNEQHQYYECSEKIKKGMLIHLYNKTDNYFIKQILQKPKDLISDDTIDISSLHGLVEFGILEVDDSRLLGTYKKVEEKLKIHTKIGGYCRYENDNYFRVSNDLTGNPWVFASLWIARLKIKQNKMEEAHTLIQSVTDSQVGAGMLAEQLNPFDGAPISATPLVWSHSEYIWTIEEYLKNLH